LDFATPGSSRLRQVKITGRDTMALQVQIDRMRAKWHLPADAPVISCYEAGREGFWLHPYLVGRGVMNLVVDSASIQVNRRARRAKGDRLDLKQLMGMLRRHHGREEGVWSVVRVPLISQSWRVQAWLFRSDRPRAGLIQTAVKKEGSACSACPPGQGGE